MRILLDECLPRTVPEIGWSGLKNGALLHRLAGQFDALLTVDRGLAHQQNLKGIPFGIVMLRVPSNDIDTLRPLMPKVREALATLQPGDVVRISA